MKTKALRDSPIGLFKGQPSESLFETNFPLPQMSLSEHVVYDHSTLSLSIKEHPVRFSSEKLAPSNVIPIENLGVHDDGDIVRISGLVLVRQIPGTAGGIFFMTIEDETGNANLVVFKDLFENIYRKKFFSQS